MKIGTKIGKNDKNNGIAKHLVKHSGEIPHCSLIHVYKKYGNYYDKYEWLYSQQQIKTNIIDLSHLID